MNINKAAFSSIEDANTWMDCDLMDAAKTCRKKAKSERSMGDDRGVCQTVRELRRQAVMYDEIRKERRKKEKENKPKRKASCCYCGKLTDSDTGLLFFKARLKLPTDQYDCGCMGGTD